MTRLYKNIQHIIQRYLPCVVSEHDAKDLRHRSLLARDQERQGAPRRGSGKLCWRLSARWRRHTWILFVTRAALSCSILHVSGGFRCRSFALWFATRSSALPRAFRRNASQDPVLSGFVNVAVRPIVLFFGGRNVKKFLWHACSALCFLNFCFGCVFVSSCLCASVCSTVCLAAFVLAVRFLSAMCFSAFVSPVCFSLLFRQCVCQLVCASYSQ